MPELKLGLIGRVAAAAVAAIALATPQLAQAAAPGSLTQLGDSNSCIAVGGSECPTTNGTGLNGSKDVAVSPDGKNVYVVGSTDESVAEFARNSDGSLQQIGCIADPSNDGTSSCQGGGPGAIGLVSPQAIVVSRDGQNVYVAAQDFNGNGTIAEFTRNSDGSLTSLSGHDCIAEMNPSGQSQCDDQTGFGISRPIALAMSPDDKNLYAANENDEDIAVLTRGTGGSLSQPHGNGDCVQDASVSSNECAGSAIGLVDVTGVAVSPDGNNVYTSGFNGQSGLGTIAEFTRLADGSLTQPTGSANCVETQGDNLGCGTTAIGLVGTTGLVVSPDGRNVYTASEQQAGPIAEFSRAANGALTQLPAPHDCFQEGGTFGCSATGTGIGSGFELAISSDGASVYAAAPASNCFANSCSDVAEFARNADGSLTQLGSPDSCIQNASVEGNECPLNENGRGLGGPGLALSPDGANLYVTGGGNNDIAEFARAPVPILTVSLAGSGSGAVSDADGAISCPSTCSHAYPGNTPVILTATPSPGSTFAGWSGACSGTGSCQVTMNADTAVTATFTANSSPPTPGAPTPVLTAAPTAVTDAGAGFLGSVNPEGLPTTVFFQYGLDKRYSQVGASGPNYTSQTPAQQLGPDFATHGVGPIAVAGLLPNALYHVRLVASNSAGTVFGQDVTFTTAQAPAPGAPTLGQTFNLAPVSGLVFVLIHGQLVPLTQVEQIPSGTVIDSRHGTFELVMSAGGGSAHDAAAKGKTQTGKFGGAVVRLHQATRGANRGLTTIMMVESAFKGAPTQAICKAPAADAQAAKVSSKTIQLLHASAHGKFSTSGRYSAATVRGTVWSMAARCDGTLTHDFTDSVVVTDFIRHKTIVLHAGQSYLAPGHGRK